MMLTSPSSSPAAALSRMPADVPPASARSLGVAELIYAFRWLVRDTFRQVQATRLFWILLAFSAVCTLFCLSIRIEGGALRPEGDFLYNPQTQEPLGDMPRSVGKLHLFFGAFKVDLARDRGAAVHLIQTVLGMGVAGTLGLLLTIIWTAGLLPDSLQPAHAAMLLTRAAPPWLFLLGKYMGVLLVVGLQATIFFVGTWLALGVRTGEWQAGYLAGILLLLVSFACFYAVSLFVAVHTRSAAACALGTLLFWGVAAGMNYARHAVAALPQLAPQATPVTSFSRILIDAGYWILPKPIDHLILLEQALHADGQLATVSSLPEFAAVQALGAFSPVGILVSGVIFALVLIGLAGRECGKIEY